MSVAFSVLCIAIQVPTAMKKDLNTKYPDGITINFYNFNSNEIHLLKNLDLYISSLNFSASSSILRNCVFLNNANQLTIKKPLYVFPTNEQAISKLNNSIVVGENWTKSDFYLNDGFFSVWINEIISESYGLGVNDIIKIKVENALLITIVRGVFSNSYINNDIMFSYNAMQQLITERHYIDTCEGQLILYTASQYLSLIKILENVNVRYEKSTQIIDFVRGIQITTYLFISLTIIINSAGIGVLYTLSRMLIKNRESFIAIMKMLGMKSSDITLIYFCILEITLLISIVIAIFLSIIINSIISLPLMYIISDGFSLRLSPFVPIVCFIISNVLLIFALLRLQCRINRIDIINTLLIKE
ncbi:MAG: hypothetical protein LBC71_00455 [Oscillospiraceae bacterium]|nr:hypothetical protein [Oscillospiraceae bacterium]